MLPEAKRVQQVIHGQRLLGEVLANLDVLAYRKVGHEVVELEDEAKLASAVPHKLLAGNLGDVGITHDDAAGICGLKATHNVQERRLARARWAEKDADLTLGDGAVDASQHLDARLSLTIVLLDALDDEVCLTLFHAVSPSSRADADGCQAATWSLKIITPGRPRGQAHRSCADSFTVGKAHWQISEPARGGVRSTGMACGFHRECGRETGRMRGVREQCTQIAEFQAN